MKKLIFLLGICTLLFSNAIFSQNARSYNTTYLEFTTNMRDPNVVNFSGFFLKIDDNRWIVKVNNPSYSAAPSILQYESSRNNILRLKLDRYTTFEINFDYNRIYSNSSIFNNAAFYNPIVGPKLPSENTDARIIARHSNKYLGVQENNFNSGAPVYQSSASHSSNQDFKFKITPDGYYNILIDQQRNYQMALDVTGGSSADGTRIIQYYYDINNNNQKFLLIPVDRDYFKIMTFNGKVLDIFGGITSTGDGIILHQWHYHGGHNQHFQISQYSFSSNSFREGRQ